MSESGSDAPLEAAMAEFIRQREEALQGDRAAPTPDAFASGYPELGERLVRALEHLAETEELFVPDGGHLPLSIGPYRVLGELGRGGMGRVLRVVHPDRPGHELALKLLGLSAQLNPRMAKRFEREAHCIKGLEHPGIVRVHEFNAGGDEPFMIMDIVEGRSLGDLLAAARAEKDDPSPKAMGRLDETQTWNLAPGQNSNEELRSAVRVMAKLARAAEALHANGVVHRDIKPSNVIIKPDGQPVLIDFGLAMEEDSSTLTHTGDLLGTPHYMAPEQARGEPMDERVDVYAMGAMLYELMCLAPPHAMPNTQSDPILILEAIRRKPIRSIRSLAPHVPRPLARIIGRALAFRKSSRYASADALAQDLEAFLAGERPAARSMLWEQCLLGAGRQWRRIGLLAALLLGLLFWPRGEELAGPQLDPIQALRQATDRAAMAWGLDDLEETRLAAGEMLTLDPGNSTAEFLLVMAAGDPPVDSEDPSIEALIYGMKRYNEGRLREARAEFRRAAKLDPDSPLPLVMGAKIAGEESELEEQEIQLVAALERDPSSAALSRELGRIYYELERFPQAVESLRHALENDPTYVRTYYDLARAQVQVDGYAAGLATAQEASDRFGLPGDRILRFFCGHLMIEKQYDMARDALLGIAYRHGSDAQFCLDIARTYDYAEKIAEALPWYQKAILLDPDHEEALKGLLHLRTGANRATCEDCVAAFEDHPEMYDPDQAARHGAHLLKLSAGKNLGLTLWVVEKLVLVEREFEAEQALADALAGPVSKRSRANLQQALVKLQNAEF